METKVSISLVIYNGEKYIRHCLNGILAQTYPHELIEVNFLDNSSTDKTKEIIRSWGLENGRLFNKYNLVEADDFYYDGKSSKIYFIQKEKLYSFEI